MALRLGIGWHFWREGVSKVEDPKPFSAGFLSNAKGPMADTFHAMVWDADGLARLDYEATRKAWQQYRERVAQHYQFDEKQRAQAEKVYQSFEGQLEWFFNTNAEDIDKYLKGLERRDRNHHDAARSQVASLAQQSAAWEADLRKQRGPLLSAIDGMWANYQDELNALADPSQGQTQRPLRLHKPGRHMFDSEFVDSVIPYFDMAVGALLVVGLFTRFTSVVGALFLGTVISTQILGGPGAVPVYYQTIEMLALLVLAAVGAGRFAGLDYILRAVRLKCCPPKQETSA